MSWFDNPLKVSDLNKIDINLVKDPDRPQGLRYCLRKTEGTTTIPTDDLIFHNIYSRVNDLANSSFDNIDDLRKIRDFIPKLKRAEESGRGYLDNDKDWWYRLKTIVCRFFGVTPISGSHEQRLIDLKNNVNQRIGELEGLEKNTETGKKPFPQRTGELGLEKPTETDNKPVQGNITYTIEIVKDKKSDKLVLGTGNKIQLNEAQKERLSEVEYFKKMFEWKGEHKSGELEYIIDNMNIWLSLQNVPLKTLKETIRIEKNITKDRIALKLITEKVQTGIDYVLNNIHVAHQLNNQQLLSFWEELLIENIELSLDDMETIHSLMEMSQNLQLQIVSTHLLKFLIANRKEETVIKFIQNYPNKILFNTLELSLICPDSYGEDGAFSLAFQSKLIVNTLEINSSTGGHELLELPWFKQVNKVVVEDAVTNRCMDSLIENMANQNNIKEIDFRSSWFDNGYSSTREEGLKSKGFEKLPNQGKIFRRK